MHHPNLEPLAEPLERLLELARRDPRLSAALRALAQALLAALPEDEAGEPPADTPPSTAPPSTDPPLTRPTPPDDEPHTHPEAASHEDVEHLIAAFRHHPAPTPQPLESSHTFEPEALQARLLLKAQACRWLQEYGYTDDGAALAARRDLIERGQDLSCYLWMLDPRRVNPAASAHHELLANAFEVTAEALALWCECQEAPEGVEAAELLAEAQAALRLACASARGADPQLLQDLDPDQQLVFGELRRFAELSGIYLPFLKLESAPDPAAYAERRKHIARLRARYEARTRTALEQARRLRRLTYHSEKLQRGSHNPAHDLKRVRETVHELVAAGLPESAPEFDAPLRPILKELADTSDDPLLTRVIGFVRTRAAPKQPERTPHPTPSSPEVGRLARLLAGKTVVMIGGERRADKAAEIEAAFGCRLEWLETRPHQSHYDFAPAIMRKEVALVLLLIRWSSHGFAEVIDICRQHGKPLVRVTAGYGINSLAQAIMQQASRQLETTAR